MNNNNKRKNIIIKIETVFYNVLVLVLIFGPIKITLPKLKCIYNGMNIKKNLLEHFLL